MVVEGGVSAEEVWMSVSCHQTWEVLPALIRVSEEHKEQGRLFCIREKSRSAGRVQAGVGGVGGRRDGGREGCCLDGNNK